MNVHKIVTTKNCLKDIVNRGCLNCGNKENFSYFGVSGIYTCEACGTQYGINSKAIANMLDTPDKSIVRFYHNDKINIDNESYDFVLETKPKTRKKIAKSDNKISER